ncbi:MAG: hypothetical protein NC818_00445 [Candidatus Omnitrophica bacterium]|nr:hypothetical protein [Candidatus Omnitrophota bacterium]
MQEKIDKINAGIVEMARITLEMWQLTHRAFMEHNLDLFSTILADENQLNDLEKQLTSQLVEMSRSISLSLGKKEEACIASYIEIVEDIEVIGDYCKDILERLEIKISEKLLFSEDAVSDYNILYLRTEEAMKTLYTALEKRELSSLKKIIDGLKDTEHLLEALQKNHHQRLIKGICSPLSGNMFINMLDFTALAYQQINKIARAFLKIKQ